MMEPTVRRSIEDAIKRLMSLLDIIDGDTDFEPEAMEANIAGWLGNMDDREFDDVDFDIPGYIAGGQGL